MRIGENGIGTGGCEGPETTPLAAAPGVNVGAFGCAGGALPTGARFDGPGPAAGPVTGAAGGTIPIGAPPAGAAAAGIDAGGPPAAGAGAADAALAAVCATCAAVLPAVP